MEQENGIPRKYLKDNSEELTRFFYEITKFRIEGPIFRSYLKLANLNLAFIYLSYFYIWVFFHDHSRITGLQEKREGISLTPNYHFHPLYRHLDIS